MRKRFILITGTPCTGKTTIARHLTAKMDALYINLTELANCYGLILGEDKERNTKIIDEEKMRVKIAETIEATEKHTVIIDGHYAPAVVPKSYVSRIFVLRRNPIELRKLMEKRGYSDAKIWENLASEILDVCLLEALSEQAKERVCEIDITDKTDEQVSNEIIDILAARKKCPSNKVDWLGMLEKKGLLDEYMKI